MTPEPDSYRVVYVAAYVVVAVVHVGYVASLVIRSRRAAARLQAARSRASVFPA